MRGGPPKLKAEARVSQAAPTSPVVYGPPPPPARASPHFQWGDAADGEQARARREQPGRRLCEAPRPR